MDGNLVAETVLSESDEGMIGSFYLSTQFFFLHIFYCISANFITFRTLLLSGCMYKCIRIKSWCHLVTTNQPSIQSNKHTIEIF